MEVMVPFTEGHGTAGEAYVERRVGGGTGKDV